jgi:hypothetical protein
VHSPEKLSLANSRCYRRLVMSAILDQRSLKKQTRRNRDDGVIAIVMERAKASSA